MVLKCKSKPEKYSLHIFNCQSSFGLICFKGSKTHSDESGLSDSENEVNLLSTLTLQQRSLIDIHWSERYPGTDHIQTS